MSPRADVQEIGATAPASRLFRDLRSVPNLLSLSRIALIYLAAALFLLAHPFWAMGIGILAGVTDYLDGYIARRTGQVTQLGAILDRLSDLVFETTWLVLATFFHFLPPVFLLLYLLRELVVLSARLYCGERGVALRSSFVGKLKTNFFGYSAILVFVPIAESLAPYHRALSLIGFLGVSIGLALSYWSAFGYLKTFARAYDDGE